MEPPAALDPRARRFAQGIEAVVLLGGFVFRQPVALPVIAVCAALGAAFGPGANPICGIWTVLVAPRLDPPVVHEGPDAQRADDRLATAVVGLATLLWLMGLGGLGWLLGLGQAAVGAIAASTGAAVALWLWTRLTRRMRR